MSIDDLLEVLDRAHNGPICTVENWDTKVVPEATLSKLKEHKLLQTCDRANPVNVDNGLAKEFFEAAYELAVELGVLCTNTERIIKVNEGELKSAIRNSPKSLALGDGRDKVHLVHRKPEDPGMPLFGAPLGIAVTEDIYVRLMEAIVRDRLIDVFRGGSLMTVHGREIRSGTPYETVAGRVETEYHKEILRRAGRPGMPTMAVVSSVTDLAQFTGYGTIGGKDPKKDIALLLSPSELKTNYASFNKVAQAIIVGGSISSGGHSFIGGYAGPAEGAALMAIASSLLRRFIHKASCASAQVIDMRYNGNAGRDAIWAQSIAVQSISQSAELVTPTTATPMAGPDTEMLLYETAVMMVSSAVSGTSLVLGPRSAGGKWTNHVTPLECKFSSEILKGCRNMKRTTANEIIGELIPKYESALGNAPKGRSVLECCDIDTFTPKEEWSRKYGKVKKDLEDRGVRFA